MPEGLSDEDSRIFLPFFFLALGAPRDLPQVGPAIREAARVSVYSLQPRLPLPL